MSVTIREKLEEHLINKGGFRTALAIQGGGMRGVYSGGAVAHLEKSGLRTAFDVVVGSSAGAINGLFLLSGQSPIAVRLYIDHLNNSKFINPLRLTRIVDVDFMVDTALKTICPIDVEALRESPCLLQVVMTDSKTGEARVVTNRDEHVDIYEAVRATAALPALYNKKILVDGHRCIDGGIIEPIPVFRALESKPDLTIAIASHPRGFRHPPMSRAFKAVQRMALRGQTDTIKEMVETIAIRYSLANELLESESSNSRGIYGLWPSDISKLASRTTKSRELLESCREMGERDMQSLLDSPYINPNDD